VVILDGERVLLERGDKIVLAKTIVEEIPENPDVTAFSRELADLSDEATVRYC